MADTSSIASFEEIADRDGMSPIPVPYWGPRAEAAAGGTPDVADEDVPDICYVLQYNKYGKGLVEVQRGPKPIDPHLREASDETGRKGKKKPVLEITTIVSTSVVGIQPSCGYRYPPSRCQQWGYPVSPEPHGGFDEPDLQTARFGNATMTIRSRHLINALAAVVGYYPGVSFIADEVKIGAPYSVLIHHRAALARYKYAQPETHGEEYASTTSKHIDILLGFLEETYGDRIREEEDRHSRKTPTATHEWLWLLLRPGDVVYTQHDSTWVPFVISRVFPKAVSGYSDGLTSHSIDCWHYMYTDGRLRRKMYTFEIPPFSGEEAIHNLSVVPARFFMGPDKDMAPSAATAEQIRLGRLAWDLYKEPSHKAYDGELAKKSWSPHTPNWDYNNWPTGHRTGRVIVDGEGFERNSQKCPLENRRHRLPYNDDAPLPGPTLLDQLPYFAPRCACQACGERRGGRGELSRFAAFQDLNPAADEAPADELYFHVVSKVIAGFLLGERRWAYFHVARLRDVRFDREAFRYLVLDDEIKTTVKGLLGKFASVEGRVSAWPSDFVKNKGQGRIFLLHGSPGVGKTCTAECVAELTRRPLLSLTSGDLSTYSSQVEQNLEYFLNLGERFGAIVLLDEADVYLEARNKDIERNGLVSVFLRALEYYRGVLFLTTNRVQTFDAAFTSRIHVALHYAALTDADRERIWQNGFDRLERESAGRLRAAVAAREYAWASADVRSLRWNGREIRNALQTAAALAESEALEEADEAAAEDGTGGGDGIVVLVTEKHLRCVVRMSRGFKNFMQRNRLCDDEEDDDDDEVPLFSDDEDDGIRHRDDESISM
ncbi:P-loop containing nucleoside triphosphate hydrolase protein [Xylaria palmicola]|nr:P-loop containing nucleoside triphosphate hydrolase protein [Xylaria palmicola]